jgi:hypothetical protein
MGVLYAVDEEEGQQVVVVAAHIGCGAGVSTSNV